jgi:ABC-type branched-subunit amino acid transport system substrate-binding protein
MAYYLLTRKYPFDGDTAQLKWDHQNTTPAAPSTCPDCSHIPSTIDAVILHALAKQPEKRYGTVQDFTNAFREACELEPLSVAGQRRSTGLLEPAPAQEGNAIAPHTSTPLREPSLPRRGLNLLNPDHPRWWIRLIATVMVALLLISIIIGFLFSTFPSIIPAPTQNTLCDRNCVIDTGTINAQLKDKARSSQLRRDDKDACEYWYWASQEEPTDGEARIAYQNYLFRPDSQDPCSTLINASLHINLVTVVQGNDALDSGSRAILQGVALRQQEFNDAHPNGPLLHIFLAKMGERTDQQDFAQQIIAATKVKGQAVAGVVGLPVGSEGLISILSDSNIPMISTMSTDDTTTTPFLLSVAPSFRDQAKAAINIIKYKNAHSSTPLKVAAFYKSDDTYGRKIVDTFWQESKSQSINSPLPYGYVSVSDLIQNMQSINDLSILYLAGTSDDVKQLLTMLPKKDIPLQILGPADMYQWVYQNYTSEEMRDLVDLQFTAFAYHDTGAIHDPVNSQCVVAGSIHTDPQYNILDDYKKDFASDSIYFGSAYTHDIPSSDTLLAYDAVSLMDTAAISAGNSLSTQTLWKALQQFTSAHPFPGFSGQISFQEGKSAPYKKAVLLITIAKQENSIVNIITPIADTSATVWEGCYQFASK